MKPTVRNWTIFTVCTCTAFLLVHTGAIDLNSLSFLDGHPSKPSQPSESLLLMQRIDAAEFVFRTKILRDPDSATFTFEKRGSNSLLVRVRAQNGFGGFEVQRFVLRFAPGSVDLEDVTEEH